MRFLTPRGARTRTIHNIPMVRFTRDTQFRCQSSCQSTETCNPVSVESVLIVKFRATSCLSSTRSRGCGGRPGLYILRAAGEHGVLNGLWVFWWFRDWPVASLCVVNNCASCNSTTEWTHCSKHRARVFWDWPVGPRTSAKLQHTRRAACRHTAALAVVVCTHR